jgi:hypothetical protein
VSASTREDIAAAERVLEFDSAAVADVLTARASELAKYHAAILALARPVIRDLIVQYTAVLQTCDEDGAPLDVGTLLGAVAMALDEPRLQTTLRARVAKVRASVTLEAARQQRAVALAVDGSVKESLNS